jgi:membrane protein
MRRLRPIRKAAGLFGFYVRSIYGGFVKEDVFIWSGAIAFKVLINLLPLVVLAAGVFGLVLRQDEIRQTITNLIHAFLPTFQSEQIAELLVSLSDKGDTVTLIGSLGISFTVITLFSTLRVVVGNIFKGTHQRRSLWRGYVLDLGLATLGGSLFLLSFGTTLALEILDTRGSALLSRLDVLEFGFVNVWLWISRFLELVIPGLLSAALFFQLYFFIPLPRPHRISALVGAVTTAVFWEIAKRIFTVYAVQLGTFDSYSGLGTLGLAVAVVLWTYYSGLVFIMGAMVTAIHDEKFFEAQWSSPSDSPPANQASSLPKPNRLDGETENDQHRARQSG